MVEANVSQEAINALRSMSGKAGELAGNLHQALTDLVIALDENVGGLGGHSKEISALIHDILDSEDDAKIPVLKLQLKLDRYAMIRQKHLDAEHYGSTKSKKL